MQLSRSGFSKQLGILPFANQYAEIFNHVDVIVYSIIAWIGIGLQEASGLGFIFVSVMEYSWTCHILVGI